MKRVLTTLTLSMALCALAGAARAQVGSPQEEQKYFRVPHKYHIYLELGGALPSEPGVFNDYWNSSLLFAVGGGVNVLPWLDVNANYTYSSWTNNSTASKPVIGFVGVPDVEGGLITTMTFSGSARFLAVPNARTNPFAEMAIGFYQTTGENIVIEGVVDNSMPDASGMLLAPAIGIQYALADSWSAYAKYAYILCTGTSFAPGDLLAPEGGAPPVDGENEVFQTITVGIVLRF